MIDITYFGYGVGLVMSGWFIGSCVAVVFSVIRRAF
jgi:hypothetical protein